MNTAAQERFHATVLGLASSFSLIGSSAAPVPSTATVRRASSSKGSRLLDRVRQSLRRWRIARARRASIVALNRLSDRDLADIGISRHEIAAIVHERVPGSPGVRELGHDRWTAPAARRGASNSAIYDSAV